MEKKWVVLRGLFWLGIGVGISACGINGPSITGRPDLARNQPGNSPDIGVEPDIVVPPEVNPPPTTPLPPTAEVPNPVSFLDGKYVVWMRFEKRSKLGTLLARRVFDMDLLFWAQTVDPRYPQREVQDDSGVDFGVATVRNSVPVGLKPIPLAVRRVTSMDGRRERLELTGFAAIRLLKAIFPREWINGDFRDIENQFFLLSEHPVEWGRHWKSERTCSPVRHGDIRMVSSQWMVQVGVSPDYTRMPECDRP